MAEDTGPPPSININTFAAGEIAPALYGRTDLTKFHQSAALMRNMFVDYKGGASSRPGTQFIGHPETPEFCRLIPFQFSTDINQCYVLVLSDGSMRFIRATSNPYYPNGSDSGFILTGGGVPYAIATPWNHTELRTLDYLQITDRVVFTHRNHAPLRLSRIADANWTLTPIVTGQSPLPAPEIINIAISGPPPDSTDPQTTRYIYTVTAVDTDNNESFNLPAISGPGIDIGATQGTVTVFWNPVDGAVFYRVYKGIPCSGNVFPDKTSQFGFVGFAYGTIFTDGNIVPDFTQTPILFNDPFAGGQVVGYTITGSSGDWPVGSTTIVITGDGSGAAAYPILSSNTPATNGFIKGLYIWARGSGYTTATATAVGTGTVFTATLQLSPLTGTFPAVVGLIDQRLVYASTANKPLTIFGSRPNAFNDFRVTNPVVDSDAFEFTIASRQANNVVWLEAMPGGLVIGTDSRILQLTGGSSLPNNPAAITPTAAVIVPQSSYGAAPGIDPIVIDYDILYVQSEDAVVRALSYSFYANIYTGTDIIAFSSHLFFPNTVVSWAYQDNPYKVIWAVLSSGALLSLTFFKAQEISAWARHDTQGFVEDITVVREGAEDAIYISVVRNGARCIERLAGRYYYAIDDAWCLDSALSTPATYPTQTIFLDGPGPGIVHGTVVTPMFSGGDFGKTWRFGSAKGVVQSVDSPTQITISLFGPPYSPTITAVPGGFWRLDSNVSSVGGLSHLDGLSVMALVDGVPQGPFTVAGGNITLTTPGSSVVVGLPFMAQLQTNYLDVSGEQTLQGRRKKIAAVTLRVKDASKVKYGTQFDRLQEFFQGTSSTDPVEYWPFIIPPAVGLQFGDIRQAIDPIFNRTGSVCIQQDQPLPLTVLAAIPEVVPGDAK